MSSESLGYDIITMGLVGISGLLVKVFLSENNSEDGTKGPAAGSVWGYGVTAASVIISMFVTFSIVSQTTETDEKNKFWFVAKMFAHSIPSILLIGILVWLIAINAIYYNKINKGDVAAEYYNYSNVSTFLVFVQSIILFKYIRELQKARKENDVNNIENIFNSKLKPVTYLLTMLNIVLAGIMTIILEYFSTDG